MATQAVVYKEHTLGLLDPGNIIGVLHASVLRGAPFSVHSTPIFASEQEFRQATLADFEAFRVKWHSDYLVAG